MSLTKDFYITPGIRIPERDVMGGVADARPASVGVEYVKFEV